MGKAAAAIPAAVSLAQGVGGAVSKGGSKSAAQPAAVDPTALAAAQTASNISTAQNQAALNNSNTYSPYGSSIWTPTTNAQGQTTYTLNQTLSPELQQLFGTQSGLAQNLVSNAAYGLSQSGPALANLGTNLFGSLGNVAGQIPTSLNLSGVAPITQLSPSSFQTNVAQGPVQTSVNSNFPQLVKQAQDAAYGAQTQYLNPQFQQAQSNLQQQLADQGIQEGTPAYSRAMLDFNNQKQQAYQSAQDQAVAAGNQQQQALFGQSLQAGQFANQAQQQMFGQGLNLADLYNQAVLGAAGQQNTAAQLGLQQQQAMAQQPVNALQALLAAGTGAYGAGLQGLQGAAGMINQAPTWPLSIPTYGGQQTTIQPTNYPQIQAAATGANTLANAAFNRNASGLTDTLSSVLFGQGGIGNMVGQTGLFGKLFGGGDSSSGGSFDPTGFADQDFSG